MTWKYLFLASLGLWLATFVLINCTQPAQSAQQASSATPARASAAPVGDTPDQRLTDCNPNSPHYQPGACDSIYHQVNAYQDLLHALDVIKHHLDTTHQVFVGQKPIPGRELLTELSRLRGFRFKVSEVKRLLAKADDDDYFYTMLAVNNGSHSVERRKKMCPDSLCTPIVYLDMYLQIKAAAGDESGNNQVVSSLGANIQEDDGGNETDFPLPCPPSCP